MIRARRGVNVHRLLDFQIRKRRDRAIRRRRLGGADDARRVPRHARLSGWPDEAQRRVALDVVKIQSLQRRARRERRIVLTHREIRAAQREGPLLARLGATAGARKILPRNAALDRPAFVGVEVIVQRAIEAHVRFEMKRAVAFETVETAASARRQEHVERGVGGIELEFVVAFFVLRGFEKNFKNVAEPEVAVVIRLARVNVVILHLGVEIEEVAIPQQPRLRRGRGRMRARAEPRHREIRDDLRAPPRGFVGLAVERDAALEPAAFEGDGSGGGRRGRGGFW